MPKRTPLQKLQLELSQVRKQQARLVGEVSKEALKIVLQVDELMKDLGGHLRSMRLSARLSQEKVSVALGRQSNVMWRVEHHPETIRLARYAKLLAIYGKAASALRIVGGNTMKSVSAGK
jgi:ribosome-binding protein aMBF1 (putative translation factor)